jgi:hypothetical protein
MDYLFKAIKSLRPTAEFAYTKNDYSTIQWHVLDGEAPTQAEIDAQIVKIKAAELTAEANKAVSRAAVLERLGLTEDEVRLIIG